MIDKIKEKKASEAISAIVEDGRYFDCDEVFSGPSPNYIDFLQDIERRLNDLHFYDYFVDVGFGGTEWEIIRKCFKIYQAENK